MYLIGLTGNIASGKSTVRRMLQELGARAIDADVLAHAVLLKGTPAWRAVVDAFGLEILRADGAVNRAKLGAIVFPDRSRLQKLEAIVHPAVRTELALLLRAASEPIVVIEAVKLVEAGLHLFCDALWVVTAPYEEQKRRLMQDRRSSEADAQARLRAQPPQDEKLTLAQVVIDNGGSIEATRLQVTRAFAAIRPETATDKAPLLASLAGWSAPAQLRGPALAAAPPRPLYPERSAGQESAAPAREEADEDLKPAALPSRAAEPGEGTGAAIAVRRARPGDAALLAPLFAQAEGALEPLSRPEVLKRLGKWGYWIAEGDGQPLALAAWQVENLVAVVRELWARAPELAPRAFPPLLAVIEQEASALQCEVVVLIAHSQNIELVRAAAPAAGYAASSLDALHPLWRAVAEGEPHAGQVLYVKRLREEMVTKPN